MATPVKSAGLLINRVLSPCSPRFLLANEAGGVTPKKQVVRLFVDEVKTPKKRFDNVGIKVTKSEDLLQLNTPMRGKILKDGLDSDDKLNFVQNTLGEPVAVKIVKQTFQLNEKSALFLSHKNLVQIYDIIEKKKEKYAIIIMELCADFSTLQSQIDNSSIDLPKPKIINYAKQIARGLEYCHQNNILHMDLKPKNVLVSDCGETCKICDFGNCTQVQNQADYTFQGTVPYTAPEILLGKAPTPKSDVYSFAVLLWQLITRSSPYEGLDNQVVIYKVVKFNFRPTWTLTLPIFDDLKLVCTVCWLENADLRPNFAEIELKLSEL